MKSCQLLIVFTAILLMACNNHHKAAAKFKSVDLEKDDPVILALMDTAQVHMHVFIDSLNAHGAEMKHYVFSIKSDYAENGVHEHMWSRIFNYRDGRFRGFFADSAFRLKNIKFNDSVSIKKGDVEDWLISDLVTHKTIGEFSVKYLKRKIRETED
jgi:uncharacterized protein YegJ (DUF2314 family)